MPAGRLASGINLSFASRPVSQDLLLSISDRWTPMADMSLYTVFRTAASLVQRRKCDWFSFQKLQSRHRLLGSRLSAVLKRSLLCRRRCQCFSFLGEVRKVPTEPHTVLKSMGPRSDFHFASHDGRSDFLSCLDLVILLIENSDRRMLDFSSRNSQDSFGTELLSKRPLMNETFELFGFPQTASL